jgi:hypothetical protein
MFCGLFNNDLPTRRSASGGERPVREVLRVAAEEDNDAELAFKCDQAGTASDGND